MNRPMRQVDVSRLQPHEAHRILSGSIIPRPIAWISTLSADGVANLAPFSFCNAVCSHPPAVMFCPATAPDGSQKDTLRHVRQTGQFVYNVVPQSLVEVMNASAGPYPPHISELDMLGIATLPSVKVRPPRVALSPIQLECQVIQIVDVGDPAPGSGHIVIGQVVMAHLDERVSDASFHIDPVALDVVARLAGSQYAHLGDIYTLSRPDASPTSDPGSDQPARPR